LLVSRNHILVNEVCQVCLCNCKRETRTVARQPSHDGDLTVAHGLSHESFDNGSKCVIIGTVFNNKEGGDPMSSGIVVTRASVRTRSQGAVHFLWKH
jgi:hypothetical protein